MKLSMGSLIDVQERNSWMIGTTMCLDYSRTPTGAVIVICNIDRDGEKKTSRKGLRPSLSQIKVV